VEASQMPYSYQVAGPGIEPGTSWLWTCVFQRLSLWKLPAELLNISHLWRFWLLLNLIS